MQPSSRLLTKAETRRKSSPGGDGVSSMLRSIRLGAVIAAFALVFGSQQTVHSQMNSTSRQKPLEDALRKDLQDYLNARSKIEHISTLSLTVSFRGGSTINLAVGTTKYGGGE